MNLLVFLINLEVLKCIYKYSKRKIYFGVYFCKYYVFLLFLFMILEYIYWMEGKKVFVFFRLGKVFGIYVEK